MKKCFVIKLPVAVDNDSLPLWDTVVLKNLKSMTASSGFTSPDIGFSVSGNSVELKGNGNFVLSYNNNTNLGTKLVQSSGYDYIPFLPVNTDSDTVILVKNASNVQSVKLMYTDTESLTALVDLAESLHSYSCYGGNVDLSHFKRHTELTYLGNNNSVTGDISNLSALTNLQSFNFANCPVTGDISNLAALTNLQSINFANCHVTGDIASLATEIAKAKKAHTLNIACNGVITNGSVTPANKASVTITFAADGTYTIA